MGKAFDENEKDIINKSLLEKGRELFLTYGLKKTSIDDIIKAVGIAKGSFYKFYPSKEELFFTLLEMEDLAQKEFLSTIQALDFETFRGFIKQSVHEGINNSIASVLFDQSEYALLVRKLPKERLEKHMGADDAFAREITEKLAAGGVILNQPPKIISSLFRAIALLSLNKEQIGENYPQVQDLLIDYTLEGLKK